MSQNPQLNASNYVLNVLPLQNVINNISGLTPYDTLAGEIGQIQQMVDFSRKRINANVIASFSNSDTPISMINSLNLCNANLYSNGVLFAGGTTNVFNNGINIASGGATLILTSTNVAFTAGGGNTGLSLSSSNIVLNAQGSSNNVVVDSNTSFYNPVYISTSLTINNNPIQGTSLQCLDTLGTTAWGYVSTLETADAVTVSGSAGEIARFTSGGNVGIGIIDPTSSLDVNGTGSFTGRVTAFEFLSLSDRRFKTNITEIENPGELLAKMRGVRFMWRDLSNNDIGVIAQELQEVLPEAVLGDEELTPKLSVAYHKIIPVLIEVVKNLQVRIQHLETSIKNIEKG
jgi:hypothetical protein